MSYSSLPTSKLFQLTFLTCSLALAGCGGGDGTDIIAPKPDLGPSTGGSTESPIKNTNVSTVSITDSAGQSTRVITSSGATAVVKVTDAKGEPISGALVTFGTDAPMSAMLFGIKNGTAITNADGIASMTLTAVDPSDRGSYSLSATAVYNDVEATSPAYFFSLQSANLIFDAVRLEQSSLPYGGTTDITGLVKNSATMENQKNVEVSFSASCGTVSSATTNVLGFRATYDAGTCEGTQTIVATIGESGATIRLPVTINQRTALGALSIRCISGDTPNFPGSSPEVSEEAECATPVLLGVLGSTLPSVRSIEFIVSKDDGKPFANQQVKVELLSAPNDFGIGSARNQQQLNLTTDNAGRITVPLYAGTTISDKISLRATLGSRVDVTATFKNISVVSSVPTQAGFTITPSKNVLAATEKTVSGVRRLSDSTILNVIARDGSNNFVNGSTINFIAEGGTLSSNTCVVNNGRCQVTLSTAGVLPEDRRVTVLAYTSTGVKINGGFQTFLDENEDGILNSNEVKINSAYKLVYKQFVIGFADTIPTFNPNIDSSPLSANKEGTSQRSFTMFGSDRTVDQAISMPSGTKIQVQTVDNTKNDYSCSAQLISNGVTSNILTVANEIELYIPDTPSIPIGKQNNADKSYILRAQNCDAGDEIKLTITTPSPNVKATLITIPVA